MRSILKACLALAVAILGLNGISVTARPEIVELQTVDPRGGVHATSLWVADVDGQTWIRARDPAALWLARLRAEPQVFLVRDGVRRPYRAALVSEGRPRVDEAMRSKYGRADVWLKRLGDPADAVAIRLDPGREPSSWGEVYP